MDVVHRACDGPPSRPPAVVVHLAWGPLTRHGAGGGNLKKPGSTTRATSTLAYSNLSPSSHGSEMVKSGRKGLILTKPKNLNPTVVRLEGFGILFIPLSANFSWMSVYVITYHNSKPIRFERVWEPLKRFIKSCILTSCSLSKKM